MTRPASRKRTKTIKIATFNINNVNRRLPNLLTWLAEASPDVVCLQDSNPLTQTSRSPPSGTPDTVPYGEVRKRGTGSPSWSEEPNRS